MHEIDIYILSIFQISFLEGKIPSSVTVPSIISIHPTPNCDETTNLEKAYKRSMNSNACNRAGNCKVDVSLPGCKRRRKRELEDNSTMIVSFTLDMENVQVNGRLHSVVYTYIF